MSELLKKIEQANAEIKLTGLDRKDKDGNEIMYATVPERVKAFRKVFPGGTITAEIVENTDQQIVMIAEVLNDQGELIATGHAKENKNSGYVNKTSWLENCETSAIGRALGFAGFGIDSAIATAEETSAALAEQDRIKTEEVAKQPIGLDRAIALQAAIEKAGLSVAYICEKCRVEDLADITEKQLRNVNEHLNKLEKEARKKK